MDKVNLKDWEKIVYLFERMRRDQRKKKDNDEIEWLKKLGMSGMKDKKKWIENYRSVKEWKKEKR